GRGRVRHPDGRGRATDAERGRERHPGGREPDAGRGPGGGPARAAGAAMKFLVKICGVTRPQDAELAVKAGAGAIGINFWRGSKRFVEDAQAREILSAVPPSVLRVGVFVNAHPLVVTETVAEMKLDRVQLHGDEKVGSWTDLPNDQIIRAIRVYDESSLKEALSWEPSLFIYDAYTESFGGAGIPAPWN